MAQQLLGSGAAWERPYQCGEQCCLGKHTVRSTFSGMQYFICGWAYRILAVVRSQATERVGNSPLQHPPVGFGDSRLRATPVVPALIAESRRKYGSLAA